MDSDSLPVSPASVVPRNRLPAIPLIEPSCALASGWREPETEPSSCVVACLLEGALMTITRRDWWGGIAIVTAALLLNSVHGLYSLSWTYWATH